MTVNNVRKQTKSDEVASTAKQLIKGWKKLVPGIVYLSNPNDKHIHKQTSSVNEQNITLE